MTDSREKSEAVDWDSFEWWEMPLFFAFVGLILIWSIFNEYGWAFVAAGVVGLGIWTWPASKPFLMAGLATLALVLTAAILIAAIGGIAVYIGYKVELGDVFNAK